MTKKYIEGYFLHRLSRIRPPTQLFSLEFGYRKTVISDIDRTLFYHDDGVALDVRIV